MKNLIKYDIIKTKNKTCPHRKGEIMNNETLFEFVTQRQKILNILRCNSAIEKTALAKKVDISFATLVKQLNDLKERNILLGDSKMELNPSAYYLCGISIGGAQCKVTLIDAKYIVLNREDFNKLCEKYSVFQQSFFRKNTDIKAKYGYKYFDTPSDEITLKSYLNEILKDIIKLHDLSSGNEIPPILSIGIAITGSIDAQKQIIISSQNVDYLKNISKEMLFSPDILQTLRKKQIPFIIDHNAKALAVCEKYSLYQSDNINNEYQNKRNVASFYLGSGIGCGLIMDNRLIRGCRNLNGELGHIQVPRYPKIDTIMESNCSCGAESCLEHYIIHDVFGMTREEFKKVYLAALSPLEKKEKLEILGYYIGWAIDLVIKLLNVGLIIFSGKMTCFMDELWQYIMPISGSIDSGMLDCSMIISKYGALSPAIGAAILSNYPANYSIVWYE